MPYPRRCPLCRHSYGEAGAHIAGQVTVCSEPGGTPGAAFLDRPGRLLILKCLACGDEYRWDFFADAKPTPKLAEFVAVRRQRPDGSTVIEFPPPAPAR